MKKIQWIKLVFMLICVVALSACGESEENQTTNQITNNTESDETDETTATGGHVHEFSEWSIVKDATCTEKGEREHFCSCGEKEVEIIDAKGHVEIIVAAVDATCTQTGLTEGRYCSECGLVLAEQTVIPIGNHLYDNDSDEKCNNCEFIRVLNCTHLKTEIIAEVSATCTRDGLSAGKKCTDCGEILVAQTVVEAKGHTVVKDNAVSPTCTTAGKTEGKHCSSCNKIIVAQVTIEAKGHVEVVDEGYPATFGEAGLTSGKHCSVCNKIIVEQTKIPALGENTFVSGNDYMDENNKTKYRYSYSLAVTDGNKFTLTILTIGSDETYSLDYEDGQFISLENGIYELKFKSGKESMYVKFVEEKFEFCNADGSEWNKEKYETVIGTTEVPLTPRKGNSSYGYYKLANNTHGRDMQALYMRMYYACEAFMNCTENVVLQNGEYIISSINLNHYVITLDEVVSVWKVFYEENPRYYWLANSCAVENGQLNLCIDKDYASASNRASCDKAIADMEKACSALLKSSMSDLEVSLTIHDFILGYMNYAYESDGVTPQDDVWAHNMVGCAKHKMGVCEAYAKTYLYLCLLNDVDCIIVTGEAGEPHAWNMICINDAWYGVDVTWDETNTSELSHACFGMSKSYSAETHTPDSFEKYGIHYLYALPELSTRSIELVTLYEGSSPVGTFENIDAAFAAMTNKNGTYEIRLKLYEAQGPLLLASPNIVHSIQSQATPQVKSISIIGVSESFDNGLGRVQTLHIKKGIKAESNIAFSDMCVAADNKKDAINLNGYKLTLGGHSVLEINVTGSGSTIEILEYGEFGGTVNVDTVIAYSKDSDLRVRNDMTIKNMYSSRWNYTNGINSTEWFDINIDNLYAQYDPSVDATGLFISFGGDYANVNIKNLYNKHTEKLLWEINLKEDKINTKVSIGNLHAEIDLLINGTKINVYTDVYGNDIFEVVSFNPFCIEGSNQTIITLGNASDFSKVNVKYTFTYEIPGGFGYSDVNVDYTEFFYIDSSGNVKVNIQYTWENGMCIQDNILLITDSGLKGTVEIPNTITKIADNAFCYGKNITKIVLPNTITSIGKYSFSGCTSLETLVFEGTESEWNAIEKDESWNMWMNEFDIVFTK